MNILVRGAFYRQFQETLTQAAPNARFILFEDRGEMLRLLPKADALYGGSPREDMLDRCGKLRWIHMRSAGVDRYFPQELAKRGIALTNGSGAYDIPIAEHVFAMALAAEYIFTYATRSRSGGSAAEDPPTCTAKTSAFTEWVPSERASRRSEPPLE